MMSALGMTGCLREHRDEQRRFSAAPLACFVFVLCSLAAVSGLAAAPTGQSAASGEQLRLGERMYREGILPSGEPMQAMVKGDILVPGTAFACVSCHQRGGLGSYEGRVYTLPTNAAKLFNPLYPRVKGYEMSPDPRTRSQRRSQLPPQRPAYIDETLASALRTGVDPTGRVLNDIMPRYMLDDSDLAVMTAYLKSLSPEFSPGVTDSAIHFATIIAGNVSKADRDALVLPLEQYVKNKNAMAGLYEKKIKYARMAEAMLMDKDVAYRRLSLSLWDVTGPPDTWRSQLEEHYRMAPAFAVIGGISDGHWAPIHGFCEENRIPCLLPVTKFPVVSESDWYTLYFSKGLHGEGETAARYLHRRFEEGNERKILQVMRNSPEGRSLADGFEQAWKELGHTAPVIRRLEPGETFTRHDLQALIKREKAAVLLLWDGPAIAPALHVLSGASSGVEVAFLSYGYLGKGIGLLPDEARDRIYITYPYRLPKDEARYAHHADGLIQRLHLSRDSLKTAAHAFDITNILTDALMEMQGNYYRDTFLDVIGMLKDQTLPLYERLSFGPGQRYASKGCYIVQLGRGDKPELVQKSGWVVH